LLNQPYAFQSGKHQGKAMELMMFDDYGWLVWFFNKLNSESQTGKNAAHRHLEELLEKGENRQPKKVCLQCGRKPVKYFSVFWGYDGAFSAGTHYTCCEDEKCKQALREEAAGNHIEFLPFKFSTMRRFYSKADKRRITDLFKKVFELPERLTRQVACQFFCE